MKVLNQAAFLRVSASVEAKFSARWSPCSRLCNQHIGRDAQALVQSADHGQRQRTLAVQNFIDAVALANDRFHIALLHGSSVDVGFGLP